MTLTLAAIFLVAANTADLPQGLLDALCWVESRHSVSAYKPHDGGRASLGVCQVQERTAREMGYTGTLEALQSDPEVNAFYAAKYLRYQLDTYDGDVVKAVAAYNLGHYEESAPGIPVNASYVVKVLKAWRAIR